MNFFLFRVAIASIFASLCYDAWDTRGAAGAQPENFKAAASKRQSSDSMPPPAHKEDPPREKFIKNSIGMKLALIPAGEFMMGSADSDKTACEDEKPRHRVRITKPFYLGVYPVTQGQYEQVEGTAVNPSWFRKVDYDKRKLPHEDTSELPVEGVSWSNAVRFCQLLSEKEKKQYRLPTEAEWEYACRAGSMSRYSFGDDERRLSEYAWYGGKFQRDTTHRVGEKRPNAWGLYDMHGHVWEWCADWYDENYYRNSPLDAPTGPKTGEAHVVRGGGWRSTPKFCRSAVRFYEYSAGWGVLGFRVCLVSAE